MTYNLERELVFLVIKNVNKVFFLVKQTFLKLYLTIEALWSHLLHGCVK